MRSEALRHWADLEAPGPRCIASERRRNPLSDLMGLIPKPWGCSRRCRNGGGGWQRSRTHQNSASQTHAAPLALASALSFFPFSPSLSLSLHLSFFSSQPRCLITSLQARDCPPLFLNQVPAAHLQVDNWGVFFFFFSCCFSSSLIPPLQMLRSLWCHVAPGNIPFFFLLFFNYC